MNKEIEKELILKAKYYIKFLQIVPFLEMAAICNNLSFNKVDEKSDIDIFIIAKTGRLFIVRIFVTFIFHILGVRRHGDKIVGRFCLSFFIDDSFLNFSSFVLKNDIYLAYWLKSLKPLIDNNFTSQKLLIENLWAEKYFENKNDFKIDTTFILENNLFLISLKKCFGFLLNWKVGDFIENLLKKWQLKRALNKASSIDSQNSSIIISDHILKFHHIDRRREYGSLWLNKYDKKLVTDERFFSIINK